MDFTDLAIAATTQAFTPEALAQTKISTSQIVMLIAAVGGLTMVMIGTLRRQRESRRLGGKPLREQYTRLQREKSVTQDLERVMLELDQLSRQIHGRLDTKLARLEVVIRDADERIKHLASLIHVVNGGQTADILVDGDDAAEAPPDRAGASPHATFHSLADRGLTSAQIAEQTGKTRGEVDLILALRRVRETVASSSTEGQTPESPPGPA